jgi:hypothetical protein
LLGGPADVLQAAADRAAAVDVIRERRFLAQNR